jgi:CHAT domain-containing protein
MVYENLIDSCMWLNKHKRRVALIEKSKCPSLTDLFGVGGLLISKKDGNQLKKLRENLNQVHQEIYHGTDVDLNHLMLQSMENDYEDYIESRFAKVEERKVKSKFYFTQLQNMLGEKEAILEYYYTDNALYIDVITKQTWDYKTAFLPDIKMTLATYVRGYCEYLADNRAIHHDINQELFKVLILPVRELIMGLKKLIIIPQGFLHLLPFHSFRYDGAYLIEKFEISYCANAQILLKSKKEKGYVSPKILSIGNPTEDLTGAENESIEICKHFPQSRQLLREHASKENITKSCSDYEILHFACHGCFRPDRPMFSFLMLANGERLTVYDIMDLQFNASLVVLNCCDSGINEVLPGNELLGLQRAFFYKGARNLIVNLWRTDDIVSSEVILDFFKGIVKGESYSSALHSAQLKALKKHQEPYLWAPFTLIGWG